MTAKRKEKKIVIEIFYTKKGLQYEDFSYVAEERLQGRDIMWLVSCMVHDLISEWQDRFEEYFVSRGRNIGSKKSGRVAR